MDPIERATLSLKQTQDVKIMQKVNAVNRDAFLVKYPGQVEHCLRLVMERLQAGLDKRDGVDINNPDTWRMSTEEIQELAQAAHLLNTIRQTL
jgi:hypothetical protein